jgi:hypothetical protein
MISNGWPGGMLVRMHFYRHRNGENKTNYVTICEVHLRPSSPREEHMSTQSPSISMKLNK